MYRVDVRQVGAPSLTGWFTNSAQTAPGLAIEGCTGYDAIYSFRTGQSAAASLSGIRIPRFSAKPADNLRQLGNFYRDFSESASASSTVASEEGSARYATGDVGHEMVSIKVRSQPAVGTIRNVRSNSSSYPFELHLPFLLGGMGMQSNDKLRTKFGDYLGDWSLRSGSSIRVPLNRSTTIDTQATLNRLFSQMRVESPVANVGESIVELIKGGPFALFSQLMTQWSSYLRILGKPKVSSGQLRELAGEAGGSYLYGSFAVAPFINDVKKILESLTALHTLVYGTSERMRRIGRYDTVSETVSSKLALYPPFYRGTSMSSTDLGFPTQDIQVIQSADTRLVARMGFVRPASQSNGFIDKAAALWYNLGMTEPTLMWDLTSFSWLLDWWLHLGDSITNAFAFSGSGVNVDYAYATTSVKTLATLQFAGGAPSPGTINRPSVASQQLRQFSTVTYRRRASPFGFGGDLSSLTSGQMSILTALGLAKTR